MTIASYDDYLKIDQRVGEIVQVEDFPRAKKPAYKVQINFGAELGLKWSSVQATHYTREALLGRQVIAVVNFAPKNIAGFLSEVLVQGVSDDHGALVLLEPGRRAALGSRVY